MKRIILLLAVLLLANPAASLSDIGRSGSEGDPVTEADITPSMSAGNYFVGKAYRNASIVLEHNGGLVADLYGCDTADYDATMCDSLASLDADLNSSVSTGRRNYIVVVTTPSSSTAYLTLKGGYTSASSGVGMSVKDMGATGDGVTNDAAAINATILAVDAASGGNGGTVYFPCGDYAIVPTGSAFFQAGTGNGAIGVDRDNIRFQGESRYCTKISLDAQSTIPSEVIAVCEDALEGATNACDSALPIYGFVMDEIHLHDKAPASHMPGYDTDINTVCQDIYDTPSGSGPQTSETGPAPPGDGFCDSDGITAAGEESHGIFLKNCAGCWVTNSIIEGFGDEGIAWEKTHSWGGVVDVECKKNGSRGSWCISTNSTSASAGGYGIDLIRIVGAEFTDDPLSDCTQACTDVNDTLCTDIYDTPSGSGPQTSETGPAPPGDGFCDTDGVTLNTYQDSGDPDGFCDLETLWFDREQTGCRVLAGYIDVEGQNVGSDTSNVRIIDPRLKGDSMNSLIAINATSGDVTNTTVSGGFIENDEPFAFAGLTMEAAAGRSLSDTRISGLTLSGPGFWMTGVDAITDTVIDGLFVRGNDTYDYRASIRLQGNGVTMRNSSVTGGDRECLQYNGGKNTLVENSSFIGCADGDNAINFSIGDYEPPNVLRGVTVSGYVPAASCTAEGEPAACCTGSGAGCSGVTIGPDVGILGIPNAQLQLYDSLVENTYFDGVKDVNRVVNTTVREWGRIGTATRYGIFNDSKGASNPDVEIRNNTVTAPAGGSNTSPCIRVAANIGNGDDAKIWNNTVSDCGDMTPAIQESGGGITGASCINNLVLCDPAITDCVDPGTPPTITCTTEIGNTYDFYK